jgi:hypothetical protein
MRTLCSLGILLCATAGAAAQVPTMAVYPAAEMQWRNGPASLPRGAQMMVLEGGHWAAGTRHFAWAEGETILQLHGQGPWTVTYVNPTDDPRGARP